jgi:hypothetical protein
LEIIVLERNGVTIAVQITVCVCRVICGGRIEVRVVAQKVRSVRRVL